MRSSFALAVFCSLVSLLATSFARAQNPSNPLDVNSDTFIAPNDYIMVTNDLNAFGSRATGFTFFDVNGDGFRTPIDALRVINYLNAHGAGPATPGGGGPENTTVPAHAAKISLVVADGGGNPISVAAVGQSIQLEVFVQDTRPAPDGVYAAYTDATYQSANLGLGGTPIYGPNFIDVFNPDTSTAGLVAHAGAYRANAPPPGGAAQEMLSIPFVAQAQGVVSFGSGPSSVAPITGVLLYDLDVAVPIADIDFQGASLTIVPEPATFVMAALGCLSLAFCRFRNRKSYARHLPD